MSLFIAVPSGESVVRTEWAMAFAGQIPPVGRLRQVSVLEGFTDVPHLRNVAVHVAQEEGAEYIMFWDDDVIPRSRVAMQTLVATMDQHPEAAVVGGVYPRRGEVPEPIVSLGPDAGLWWGWEDGEVHKVYMTSTGFTVMRLSALAELDVPTEETEDAKQLRQIFGQRPHYTDDYWLADLLIDKTWLVHGGVVCDQVDIDGRRYRVEDAKQEVAV
jgi:hypothetical protein